MQLKEANAAHSRGTVSRHTTGRVQFGTLSPFPGAGVWALSLEQGRVPKLFQHHIHEMSNSLQLPKSCQQSLSFSIEDTHTHMHAHKRTHANTHTHPCKDKVICCMRSLSSLSQPRRNSFFLYTFVENHFETSWSSFYCRWWRYRRRKVQSRLWLIFYCLHSKPLWVFLFFRLPTLISLWNSRPWERRSHTCSSCLPVYQLSAGRCMLTYRAGILSSWPFKRMRANGQQKPGGREEASSDSGGGMQAGWVPLSESVRIRVRTMCRFFFCLCLFCFFGVHWIKICWMLSAERGICRQNDFPPPPAVCL